MDHELAFARRTQTESPVAGLQDAQVREVFENKRVQDQIERTIQDSVTKYFADETVQATLAQRVQLQVNKAVDARLGEYFASAEGTALVARLVADSSGEYFKTPEMSAQVRTIVTGYLESDGKKLLVDTINTALKPTTNALASTVLKNRDRLLAEFEQQSFLGEPKASQPALYRFVQPDNVARIKREGRPVILTKQIRPQHQYDEGIINEYLERLSGAFGDQFKYVALQYGPDQQLVALVAVRQFASRFRGDARPVMELLNSEGRLSRTETSERASALFGKEAVRAARADQKVVAVLLDAALWPKPGNLVDEVAVVDGNQVLLATTSRQRLIEGILATP